MIHELKQILDAYAQAASKEIKCALVSVVDLEGSSYRKPGVRMLVDETGQMTGAISGGCVEKEVIRQSKEVFEKELPLIMEYDGRYRLGCEGVLYVLIEPFAPSNEVLVSLQNAWTKRQRIDFYSYYSRNLGVRNGLGTLVSFDGQNRCTLNVHAIEEERKDVLLFEQNYASAFRLVIVGAEHDAVQLCLLSSLNGWQVTVISSPSDPKSIQDFPGALQVVTMPPQQFAEFDFDEDTAVVLMTHSYAKDFQFLSSLQNKRVAYIGVLGAKKRMNQLCNDLLENDFSTAASLVERIHGPAGLDIGGITPQEIAISIIAEIIATVRGKMNTVQSKIQAVSELNAE